MNRTHSDMAALPPVPMVVKTRWTQPFVPLRPKMFLRIHPNYLISRPSFDPATKMSEATAKDQVSERCALSRRPTRVHELASSLTAAAAAAELEGKGFRVLAVAPPSPAAMQLMGLIALSDPAATSRVTQLKTLGCGRWWWWRKRHRTTAAIVAPCGQSRAGVSAWPIPGDARRKVSPSLPHICARRQFKLVKAFQKDGNIVGMCGDVPTMHLRYGRRRWELRCRLQPNVAAAGVVSSNPGLAGIVAAVKGRAHSNLHAKPMTVCRCCSAWASASS